MGLIHINNSAKEVTTTIKHVEPATKATDVKEKPVTKPKVHKKVVKPRYNFTNEDIYTLAQLTCGDKSIDGDGEYDIDYQANVNRHELYKVLCVVMNRVRSNSFPDTVQGVVLQKRQFDVMPRNLKSEPSIKALAFVDDWCREYNRYNREAQVVPKSHLFYEGNGIINITRVSWRN